MHALEYVDGSGNAEAYREATLDWVILRRYHENAFDTANVIICSNLLNQECWPSKLTIQFEIAGE